VLMASNIDLIEHRYLSAYVHMSRVHDFRTRHALRVSLPESEAFLFARAAALQFCLS
jgi:hypothetical protein